MRLGAKATGRVLSCKGSELLAEERESLVAGVDREVVEECLVELTPHRDGGECECPLAILGEVERLVQHLLERYAVLFGEGEEALGLTEFCL